MFLLQFKRKQAGFRPRIRGPNEGIASALAKPIIETVNGASRQFPSDARPSQLDLVDEFAELDRQVRLFAPKVARYEALKKRMVPDSEPTDPDPRKPLTTFVIDELQRSGSSQ